MCVIAVMLNIFWALEPISTRTFIVLAEPTIIFFYKYSLVECMLEPTTPLNFKLYKSKV